MAERLDPSNLYDRMLALEGDTIELGIDKPLDKISAQPDLMFSSEALEVLRTEMISWVASRMTRYWNKTGRPVRNLRVELKVSTTTSIFETPVEPSITVSFTLPDIRHRGGAL